jgi:hypothetical protein
MGTLVYDFLNDSLLFDESLLEDNYREIDEARLEEELASYRLFITECLDDLHQEIGADNSLLRLFGNKDHFTIDRLNQAAFYLDQVVLSDPLFPLTHTSSDIAQSMKSYLGVPEDPLVNRSELTAAIRRMQSLRPMIAADYVKFYPSSFHSEPPEKMPVNFSEDGYESALPPKLMQYYRKNVVARSMRKIDKVLVVDNELRIGRGLAIGFKDDNSDLFQLYHYWQQEVAKIDEDTRTVYFQMTLPEEDPPVEEWKNWVAQSINQSALGHFTNIIQDLSLCEELNASYITNSEFTINLLRQPNQAKNIKDYTAECVINLELPFLSNINTRDLMSIRQSDGEAFALFRRELEKHLRDARHESDPEKVRAKIDDIVHELRDVQLTRVEQKVRELKRGALAESLIAIGGLAGTVLTSGTSLAATLIAASAGYHTYSEYREKVRENPAYFLWKVKNA